MDIQIDNGNIVIKDYTSDFSKKLHELLSYTDKSKQYQIKKMSRNPFSRNSELYKKLVADQEGTLVDERSSVITIPSGFAYLFKNNIVTDNRKDTGKAVAFPWKTKPYELREYQSEALDLMGCHAAGQLILMYDGSLKKVEDVEVGDKVMGPNSLPRTVTRLNRGEDELFDIVPIKGESFRVNSEHVLSLRRSYSSIRPTSKHKYKHRNRAIDEEIVNISVADYLQQKKAFKHKYKLYRSDPVLFAERDLPIDPYIFGLWLGDGSSNGPEFCSIDSEIVDAFSEYTALGHLELKLKRNSEDKCPTYRLSGSGKIGGNSFLNKLKQLNVIDNKHVPNIYKISSISQRLLLLAGLLDTDGCYYEGVFDITQKNKQIADAIVYIARSLGFAAYVKPSYKVATNSKLKNPGLYYRVTITGEIQDIPTRLLRKKAAQRKQIKNVRNVGFAVQSAGRGHFYGFTVDADHLYLLADFTVTHNCNYRGLINLATGLGKTLTAIYAIRKIGRRSLVLCPSKAIADNFYQELCSAFGDSVVGYFGGGKKQIKDITVGIVQSVNNSIDQFAKHQFGLVIFDECHHMAADTFFSIAAGLSATGRMFGLTATDFRSDGKDVMIQAGVGEVLIKRDIIWGIENNWLAYPSIIMRTVETTGREYSDDKIKNYKAHVLNSSEMNERIIQDIKKCLDAKKSVLCLVNEKEHGRILADALGLPLAVGDDKNSKLYVQQLNAGSVPGLIGTGSLIGEGCDTKNVDVLVLANFVASKGPLWQNLGRGLRRQGTKTQVLVLDYKPAGSKMLTRHAEQRLEFYKAITSSIKEI